MYIRLMTLDLKLFLLLSLLTGKILINLYIKYIFNCISVQICYSGVFLSLVDKYHGDTDDLHIGVQLYKFTFYHNLLGLYSLRDTFHFLFYY